MFHNKDTSPAPNRALTAETGGTSEHDQLFENAISQALARQPSVVVTEAFAARVTKLAFEKSPKRSFWAGLRRAGYRDTAPRVAGVSAALLLGALFAFAPHTRPSFLDLRFDLQLTFLVELGGVGYLLARTGLAR